MNSVGGGRHHVRFRKRVSPPDKSKLLPHDVDAELFAELTGVTTPRTGANDMVEKNESLDVIDMAADTEAAQSGSGQGNTGGLNGCRTRHVAKGTGRGHPPGGGENSSKAKRSAGRGRGPLWTGPALIVGKGKNIVLDEADVSLGFKLQFHDGVASVAALSGESKVSRAAHLGSKLMRVDGLDVKMFTEEQLCKMLTQRPVRLTFED